MAKNTNTASVIDNTPAPVPNVPVYLETTESTVRLPWSGDTVDVTTIPAQGIAYLLQYGVNKTTQDAVSGLKARVAEAWQAYRDGKADKAHTKAMAGYAKTLGYTVDAICQWPLEDLTTRLVNKESSDRWNDVMSGKMDIPGSGNRLSGLARMAYDIAEGVIKARAKARNMKLTDANLDTLVEAYLAGPEGDNARAEAQRRMDSVGALAAVANADGDTSDIMSLLNG
jgi:hypothetical protein